ncbi:MAG: MBL fold metallo-hydrolase [Clostridia bacterium]|nr:MBL fold metallo-hydrolase [Clostridia bacterium]
MLFVSACAPKLPEVSSGDGMDSDINSLVESSELSVEGSSISDERLDDISNDLISDTDSTEESVDVPTANEMRVHVIDVWQGDSIFIELPNGKCMLIDAAERDYSGRVISLIDCLGYKKIDYLVATHPHSDHIGGMQRVVQSFKIGKVYMPKVTTDTASFINFLDALDKQGVSVTVAKAGVKFDIGDFLSAEFVAPVTIVDDLNNCSAVLKLKYDEKVFLFTGDAEIIEEETITANIDCDVLKVGHHGSYTSSGNTFLKKCTPDIAIISCGKGNDYGHPHDAALNRLDKAGVDKIYRTDVSGTVTVSTDGKNIEVSEGLVPTGYNWVLNLSGMKIHTTDCKSAVDMKEENRAYSIRTLRELQKMGYVLCGTCKPKE